MNNLKAIFSDPAFLKAVHCEKMTYQADSVILKEDDEGQDLFLIVSGEVEVVSSLQNDDHGLPARLARLSVNDLFGELSMFDSEPRSAEVIALTNCEVIKVNGPELIAYLDSHPAEGYFVIRELFMHLIMHMRQNNLRTKTALQMYFAEHNND